MAQGNYERIQTDDMDNKKGGGNDGEGNGGSDSRGEKEDMSINDDER